MTARAGCRVTVVGKPSVQAPRAAARHLGLAADELAVVGDDPPLEVPMAHEVGAMAVAVRTGIGTPDRSPTCPRRCGPTWIRRTWAPSGSSSRWADTARPFLQPSSVMARRMAYAQPSFLSRSRGACTALRRQTPVVEHRGGF
jgi:hypothetical protein